MAYNEESFWAGVTVGRQLKGIMVIDGEGAPPGKLSNITVRSQPATFVEVPANGFYGIGSVTVEGDEDLKPENIKYGVDILGVSGSYAPADPKLMAGRATIKSNGTHNYTPPGGYAGFSRYDVTVDVPTNIVSQSKIVMPNTENQRIGPDEGYNTLSYVTVVGDEDLVPSNIRSGVTIFNVTGTYLESKSQEKEVTPGSNNKIITPDYGFDTLSKVTVFGDDDLIPSNIREGVNIFGVEGSYSSGMKYQTKSATPSRYNVEVIADKGYNALAKVIINGDYNFIPEHIAKDVSIFGVTGTYVSPMKPLTVKPSFDEQYIIPADGFDGFSSVTVLPANIDNIDDDSIYRAGYDDGYNKAMDEMSGIPYIVGNPVEFILSADSWNGTTYTLKADNYKIGANNVQIGLPANDSTVNTQSVIKAALTIALVNHNNGNPPYTTLTISAVNAPTQDITIAIFGLEAIA